MRLLHALGLVLLLAACAGPGSQDREEAVERTPRPDPTLPSGALEQAAIAFEGNHSASAIKARLDEAFGHFGLETTDENYSRAGSALVALRQSAQDRGCDSCSEMEILSHMLRSSAWEAGMDFPDAAAFSLEAIIAGDQ